MAKKKNDVQDIQLVKEELLAKYGDTKVGVVKLTPEIIAALSKKPFTKDTGCYVSSKTEDNCIVHTPLNMFISLNTEYMYRRDAELDENYLQPIGYAVLVHGKRSERRYFCTKRLNGGDKRLAGMYSIGIGGHVDDGETPLQALYRELEEEVGVTGDHIFTMKRLGYIYDKSNAVGRVHIGTVRIVYLKNSDIKVMEPEKLSGEWLTIEQLLDYQKKGLLESWSSHVVSAIIDGGI